MTDAEVDEAVRQAGVSDVSDWAWCVAMQINILTGPLVNSKHGPATVTQQLCKCVCVLCALGYLLNINAAALGRSAIPPPPPANESYFSVATVFAGVVALASMGVAAYYAYNNYKGACVGSAEFAPVCSL